MLYVDDEQDNLFTLEVAVRNWFDVVTLDNPSSALDVIRNENIRVLVTDQRMPGMTGLELAKLVQDQFPSVIIIILTAYDDNETMLKALNQGGIFRYLLKPWSIHDLKQTLDSAFEAFELRRKNINLINDLVAQNKKIQRAYDEISILKEKLEVENIQLKDEFLGQSLAPEIIGNSKAIRSVFKEALQAAKSNSSVLLLGETGTGKELFAKAIHNHSSRKDKLLVKISCAAIPETLIESELFGHEKGAFTGAHKLKYGKFEVAHRGSLFLDEIGELPLAMQPKLLRVLQEGEFERIGGNNLISTDFRLIAATNRDLEQEVANGAFRSDLYYRLNILPIFIPPLRNRKDDIPLIVEHFVLVLNRELGKHITSVPKKVMDRLMQYDWPGNVRELSNVIERAYVLNQGTKLNVGSWFDSAIRSAKVESDIVSLSQNEKLHILQALKQTGWKIRGQQGAAKLLDIKPTTLESRMKKLGITRPY